MALPATGWRGATDETPSTRAARSTRLVAGHTGRAAWRFTANRQCHRNRQVRSESAAGVSPGPFVQATDRVDFFPRGGTLMTLDSVIRRQRWIWSLFAIVLPISAQIGRASCRERVCQYVYVSVVAVSLKKKNKN